MLNGKELQMVRVLREEYSLGELEERLDLTTDDLEGGLADLVDMRYEEIDEMLREDLWFLDG